MVGTSPIRLLVVDDYEPWRHFVGTTFEKYPELQIIGEASDGLEAVQKAQELLPDLILMDIGLPRLSGIEAAMRIHQLVPSAKILFISQNSDSDVVEAALSNGASGYLLKTEARQELLVAIDRVIRGETFISERLKSRSSE